MFKYGKVWTALVIEVRLYASLRRYRPSAYDADNSFVTVDVPDDISVEELLNEMEMDVADVKAVTVNGTVCDLARVLADGDRVALYPVGHAVKTN